MCPVLYFFLTLLKSFKGIEFLMLKGHYIKNLLLLEDRYIINLREVTNNFKLDTHFYSI